MSSGLICDVSTASERKPREAITCLPDPLQNPGVNQETLIRFVPSGGKEQPPQPSEWPLCPSSRKPFQRGIVPEDSSTYSGEYLHYSDPESGKQPMVAPLLRRELRRYRNDALYGELSRVVRDYTTFRTDEFHHRGSPPAVVAFHYGMNPRHQKHDGTHAIDHDRENINDTLRKDAWGACAAYTHKIATEVCQQEFENMLTTTANQIHDKATRQHSQLRSEEQRCQARTKMEEAKALQKAYREKLLFDQYEARKLVYCREPQIMKSFGGIPVTPLHTSVNHSDGDNNPFN